MTRREISFRADRRTRVWVCPSILVPLLVLAVGPVLAAWCHYLVAG